MSSATMLTCATCGHEEPEGSRFCGNCSAPFASADTLAGLGESRATMLTCMTCGHAEPEGSKFCGNCSAPFVTLAHGLGELEHSHSALAEAALTPELFSPDLALEQPLTAERLPSPPPHVTYRLRWVAAGTAVVLLVAGGSVAAALSLTGGGGTTEPITTEQQTLPSVSRPTLVDSITPRLQEIAASQSAVSARVSSLRAGVVSFAALHDAAESLAGSVIRTQQLADRIAPNYSTEAASLLLLRRALVAHLAYAEAIASFPALPRSLTHAQAQAAIDRAEQAQLAYARLAFAEPALPSFYISSADHASLLAVVPSPKPPPTAAGRLIDVVPLLMGIRPDDPLSEGRCFGPYPGASLRVSGVVHRSGFIQCGDDANGDPSRASGVYRFSGPTYPGQARLVRMTGEAVIDEFSSSSQRGSSVTWTVLYNGAPVCSKTVVWSGPRPLTRRLDCKIPAAASSGGFDVRLLQVQQIAHLASPGAFWAGLLNPKIVVEPL